MAVRNQFAHIAIEERQQDRADVRAVLIRIGKDDDLVILEALDIKILADARAQRRDDRAEFLVGEHLVDALFLHVERLAANRQNRLKAAVAPLLGAAACGIALDDEHFVLLGFSARAA